MYYNNEWVWDNICVIDSHDMNIDDCQGEHLLHFLCASTHI